MQSFLDYAAKKYYEGNPVLEDSQFDFLAEKYNYEKVGSYTSKGINHVYPMYSLKKCYKGENIIDLGSDTIETPKLDGAAVSILYVEGQLKLALTRGNGKEGLDITEKMRYLVPGRININEEVIQINGEVVAEKTIPNARNYAAGALNLKDINEFRERKLEFVAYSLNPSINETFVEDMNLLHHLGFTDVYNSGVVLESKYPTDGRVIRVNNNKLYEDLGYTASHPRGAFALKERTEGLVTTLLNVVWQVGRTGQVSPVAILEPININGATVSKATLHNIKYINDLNLELGCKVEVVRSGEIIPRVVRRVN